MPQASDRFAVSLPVVLTLAEVRRENDEMVTLYFPAPEPAEAAARAPRPQRTQRKIRPRQDDF